MNNKNKKKLTGMGGIIGAGVVTAGIIAGVTYTSPIEVPYSLEVVNQYVTELKIEMPEKENVDKVELYCNDEYVGNGLLPDKGIRSIPLIYSNLDNLSLKMYEHGKVVGTGKFKDNKLIYNR